MNPLAIWPDVGADWILYEDADLLVVDKPEGVASQAPDPARPFDLVTRLRAHLSGGTHSGGQPPQEPPDAVYLGVHQRLDQDTSGLLVFARRREANASLSAQFEGRAVRKTYVAGVTGWPAGRDHAVLRDALVRGAGKAMQVVPHPRRDATIAVTRARVLARRANRTLLELELETGRTHQARVQLAHAGAPIGGDALYGGDAAPRLMLHASMLDLAHPATGERVHFASPLPREFDEWLARGSLDEKVYDDDATLARALGRALQRRFALGRSTTGAHATTAFRLVNERGDGLPGVAVDVYGGWLVARLQLDSWLEPSRRERLLDRLAGLGFDGVYLKLRPKQANLLSRQQELSRADIAPTAPVRGSAAPAELPVLEEGVPFLVRLGDGLSTGIFLDQRGNRQRVRAASAGRSVANLFAYTCAFTVVAALGGARRTVSVDSSAAALERGRANLEHAGFGESDDHLLVTDDAFAWLGRAARRGERFDLMILDPPSYSTTKRGRFVADKDYVALASAAMALLAPGGQMLACTNHRGLSLARFRRIAFDAARAAKRELVQVKDLPDLPDYPTAPGGEPHSKSVWITAR